MNEPLEARETTSLQTYARSGGILYLLIIALGIFYEVIVRDTIIVPGNPAATMVNLRAMETMWRLGIVAELLSSVATICLVFIMYRLTKPVSKDLASIAALFNLAAVTVQTANILQLVEVLLPLGPSAYLNAFTPELQGALTMLTLESHTFGFGIALLMFGPYFLITGILIEKSRYLPGYIGILYMLSGLGYMVNGFVLVLAPDFSWIVFMVIVLPVLAGELSLALTLTAKGVNEREWRKMAEA